MISNQNMRNQIIGQKFNEQYPKLLAEKYFAEVNRLSPTWWNSLPYAFMHASPISLGITGTEFKKLAEIKWTDKIDMYQFAILNTLIEKSTPDQLVQSLPDYVELMIECEQIAQRWNAECKSIRDELEKKLNAEQDELEKGLAFNYTQKAEA